MNKLFFTLALLLIFANTHAQSLWQQTNFVNLVEGERKINPSAFKTFLLDDVLFTNLQKLIKPEHSAGAITIELPNPAGEMALYQIFEEKVLPTILGNKYPKIKTYTAIQLANKNIVAKLDYTYFGFHAMVSNGEKSYFIDPYTNINSGNYIVYYKKDISKPFNERMHCLQNEQIISDVETDLQSNVPSVTVVNKTNGTFRKNYDLALACSGEYAIAVGGAIPTKASVMSAMVTSVNRVSGIYELEYAVHLNLIANNDTLIYLDSLTDPYTNDDGGAMLGENNATLSAVIGNANFDIGHVFSTGGGGVASLGSVCGNNKAQGVTGLSNPVGDGFDVDYVAHEIGHQFGGSHTFDALTGSCNGNRSSSSAYEVGSGTTIQAYAGICDANDVQPHSDAYFSIRSLNQMGTFITSGNGRTCPDSVSYGNTAPTVVPVGDTFYMPYLTYFELTASATDAENDPMSYCWEQYNRGSVGMNWDAPTILNPIFRSFNPSKNPTRVFPVIDSCLSNTYKYLGERSPDTARTMRFKVAVRDVHNGYGCFNYSEDSIKIFVVQTPTLFRVNSQNTLGLNLQGFGNYDVIWDVAGTDAGLIAASKVDIYLSTDSGFTYPTLLATGVANDGLQSVVMPNISVNYARIKVKAADNIFFDLNDVPFKISKVNMPENISNTVLSAVEIYPNPTNDIVQIKNLKENTTLKLLNTVGQVIYESKAIGSTSVNLQAFTKGMYILKMQTAKGETQSLKLIKN